MLNTTPHLDDPDALFAALIEAHRGLDPEASRRLDARIILLLANHIGSVAIMRAAIEAAKQAAPPES
jgi:hypothetical protein